MPDVSVEAPKPIDLISPKGPATSATSDVPKVETLPDAQQKPAAADKAQQEEPATSDSGDTPAEGQEPKKKAQGVQKRIDELTRQREDERRARLDTEQRLEKTLALLEKAMTGKPAADATDDEAEPAEPDVAKYTDQNAYNADYRKYLRDMARFEGRQEFKRLQKGNEEETRKRTQEEQHRKAAADYVSRREKAKERYPDYDAVAHGDHWSPTRVMTDAIVQSEYGPDVAYYLGSNPAEAARITQLSPHGQVMELGYLSAQFRQQAKAEEKPQVSRAPAPLAPLKTASRSAPVTSAGEPSMEEYAAKRAAQLTAERRPGGRR